MNIKKRVAVVLVLLLLAAGSYWGYQRYFARGTSAIQATGTIEATTVELNTRLPGVISKLYVDAGNEVTVGQPVAELSRNDLAAQKERDALGVLKAEAQLADLSSGAREQEKDEAAAQANIARANLDKSAADFARIEVLFKEGAVSQSELERARTVMELDKNRLLAAESRLSLLNSGSRPEQIGAARTEVERNKAVLKSTESMLEDLKINSPIDGVVLTKNYQEGEYIQAGVSVATIANLDDLWIKVYIPTDDLPHIKLGQKVQFTVSGHVNVFEGVVDEIASKGEFTPKTIQTPKERTNIVFGVRIKIDNEGGILKPGMPADVTFAKEVQK